MCRFFHFSFFFFNLMEIKNIQRSCSSSKDTSLSCWGKYCKTFEPVGLTGLSYHLWSPDFLHAGLSVPEDQCNVWNQKNQQRQLLGSSRGRHLNSHSDHSDQSSTSLKSLEATLICLTNITVHLKSPIHRCFLHHKCKHCHENQDLTFAFCRSGSTLYLS